ncbi:hypothetical protein L1887_34140 [Cichorium endivia]|nr:hypothetical protein L1887_34140 [Cichorium endivia]
MRTRVRGVVWLCGSGGISDKEPKVEVATTVELSEVEAKARGSASIVVSSEMEATIIGCPEVEARSTMGWSKVAETVGVAGGGGGVGVKVVGGGGVVSNCGVAKDQGVPTTVVRRPEVYAAVE